MKHTEVILMKKRVISLTIVITLAISCLTLFSAADIATETEELGVITAELQAVMRGATATEKIPVSIWTTEIDTDIVEEVVLTKAGINRDIIREMVEAGRIAEITQEQVDEYIAAERRIYAQMQAQNHKAFVEDYAFLKKASTAENAYLCSYAPMICVELTKSQIQTLSLDSEVDTMYYAPRVELKEQMSTSLSTIHADYVRVTGNFTGAGVKIGILELGVPDDTDYPLNGVLVDTYPDNAIYSEHAQAVAEIIASNKSPLIGIVPDADLYCAAGTNALDFFTSTEWLLSKGVSVINCSVVIDAEPGFYEVHDRWTDHIAHNHSVHFVVAAGNNAGDMIVGSINSPGLAYNAITVGNLDNNGTTTESDDEIYITSSYAEWPDTVDGIYQKAPNKPDVVAPGVHIRTSSFPDGQFEPGSLVTGTSFAAAHVTGVVAQLIDQYPALATLQDLVKAMLTAAISHDVHSYTSYQVGAFEKYGAGVVDAKACTDISLRGTFASSSFSSTSTTPKTFTFTATSADNEIRVSLAWLKSVWFASGTSHNTTSTPETHVPLANLDLTIIDPNGNELSMCQYENYDANTNLVVLKFDPDVYGYGTYTVKVTIHESTGKRTYFGVAWWADRE